MADKKDSSAENALQATLSLPQTNFPMRGNLTQREPARIAHWEAINLYGKIQQQATEAGAQTFLLHDGPPFTNGDVHIGTALNKCLKDIILRYKSSRGYRTPYVPGWDCHGLPIEHKVTKNESLPEADREDPVKVRKACAAFARQHILKQRSQFQRLGVLANWDVPYSAPEGEKTNMAENRSGSEYRTMDPAYEAEELRALATFAEQNLLYRSKRTVHWSIPCKTALAEAEIEYQEHTSTSIWVPFKVRANVGSVPEAFSNFATQQGKDVNDIAFVIWTTTPWTIPSNMAIALHAELEYVCISGTRTITSGKGSEATTRTEPAGPFIVAKALVESFAQTAKITELAISEPVLGGTLKGLETVHPFMDRPERPGPVLMADFVTTDAGTGCVHIAPGHGMDDYQLGRAHGIETYCPVDDEARYMNDGFIPESFVGVPVLETTQETDKKGNVKTKHTAPANIAVIRALAAEGNLLAKQTIKHSYPHCWRSKTPLIFRAMDQWFVALDKPDAPNRQDALAAIKTVNWLPHWGEGRITAAVGNRPDWCISRQRSWGVPIPVFFNQESGEVLAEGSIMRALADKFEAPGANGQAARGTDMWFEDSAEQLLEGINIPKSWADALAAGNVVKGTDTLDVWMDSGCSHLTVVRQHPELLQGKTGEDAKADVYLEGTDQHRGWFQSSLWTSVLSTGQAPYKNVITHGFLVNQDRTKISKSDQGKGGKPQTADAYVNSYGADIVRLWVASEDYRADVPVSEKILSGITNIYRTVRNTLKFQIGNLHDFNAATDAIPLEDLTPLDKWALAELNTLTQTVTEHFEAYHFHKATQALSYFVTNTLSATYHDVLKDRLYTLAPTSHARRSSQTALHHIVRAFIKMLSPLLPFTADEAYGYLTENAEHAQGSIHTQPWPTVETAFASESFQAAHANVHAGLTEAKPAVNEALEALRTQKVIGQPLDAVVTLNVIAETPVASALQTFSPEALAELFITSGANVHVNAAAADTENADAKTITVTAKHAKELGYARCARSWRWVPETDLVPHTIGADTFRISTRCKAALETAAAA